MKVSRKAPAGLGALETVSSCGFASVANLHLRPDVRLSDLKAHNFQPIPGVSRANLTDGEPAFRRICEAIDTARRSVWVTVTFMWA
jgi:hypothetical protein